MLRCSLQCRVFIRNQHLWREEDKNGTGRGQSWTAAQAQHSLGQLARSCGESVLCRTRMNVPLNPQFAQSECGLPWKGRELRRSSSLQLTAPHVPSPTPSWEASPSLKGVWATPLCVYPSPFLGKGKNLSYCKMMFWLVNICFLNVTPLRVFKEKA